MDKEVVSMFAELFNSDPKYMTDWVMKETRGMSMEQFENAVRELYKRVRCKKVD